MKSGHPGGGRFSVLSGLHESVIYVVGIDYWKAHEHVINDDWPHEKKQAMGEHIDLMHRQVPDEE